MTDKTMTLDELLATLRARDLFAEADFITRHLSQPAERGEAVAIGRIDESESGMFVDFYPDRYLPLGAEVYTAPPLAAGVPDGWKLVPVKPTQEMVSSSIPAFLHCLGDAVPDGPKRVWQSMLSAAPSPTIDVAAVAWAWKSDGMTGWALGHVKPTPENTHQFHERNTVVRPLIFGDAK